MGIKDRVMPVVKRPVFRFLKWISKIGLLVAILVAISWSIAYGFDRLLEWVVGLVSTTG